MCVNFCSIILKEINCIKIIMRLQKDIGPIVCTVYHQCAIVLEMAKIWFVHHVHHRQSFHLFQFQNIYSSIVVKEEAILISHSHLKENTVRSGFFDPISRIKSQVISYLKSLEKFIEYRKTNKSFLKHIDILSM